MKGWIDGFQESIDFIDNNLSEVLDIGKLPAVNFVPSVHRS